MIPTGHDRIICSGGGYRPAAGEREKAGDRMNRLWLFALLAVLGAVLLTAGCTQTGSLTLDSVPAGGQVSINGMENGTAPVQMADWPSGNYTVMVQKDGYIDTLQEVRIAPGRNEAVTVTLEPIPVPAKKYPARIMDLNSGTVHDIAYLGNVAIDAPGGRITRMQFVIGKSLLENEEALYLDGGDLMLNDKDDIVVAGADTPVYSPGKDPAPGKWRIIEKINSGEDNTLERNEQFTIVVVPAPGRTISSAGRIGIDLKPLRGPPAGTAFP